MLHGGRAVEPIAGAADPDVRPPLARRCAWPRSAIARLITLQSLHVSLSDVANTQRRSPRHPLSMIEGGRPGTVTGRGLYSAGQPFNRNANDASSASYFSRSERCPDAQPHPRGECDRLGGLLKWLERGARTRVRFVPAGRLRGLSNLNRATRRQSSTSWPSANSLACSFAATSSMQVRLMLPLNWPRSSRT